MFRAADRTAGPRAATPRGQRAQCPTARERAARRGRARGTRRLARAPGQGRGRPRGALGDPAARRRRTAGRRRRPRGRGRARPQDVPKLIHKRNPPPVSAMYLPGALVVSWRSLRLPNSCGFLAPEIPVTSLYCNNLDPDSVRLYGCWTGRSKGPTPRRNSPRLTTFNPTRKERH